jgi:phenylacetate-coenzyme A ligase PaaK-like adenylate-forming protein
MIIFNETYSPILNEQKVREIYSQAKKIKREFQQIELNKIIHVLDQLSQAWIAPSPFLKEAREYLISANVFSEKIIDETLAIIPQLLNKHSVSKRLEAEFRNLACFDEFASVENFKGKVTINARGILTHITAGNVFVSFIDSWLMGIITKNINIIKLSSHNTVFPEIFYRSLKSVDHDNLLVDKFCLLEWRGGDQAIENVVKQQSDTIIAWGGEEMVENYRLNLSLKTKLIDYGPKISFQLLTEQGLKNANLDIVAKKIVQEIAAWDQQACASPQNLYYPSSFSIHTLMQKVAQQFQTLDFDISRPSSDEQVERLKEIALAEYHAANNEGYCLSGNNFILHQEKDLNLRPSPLYRSLIFKPYDNLEQLYTMLEHYSFYLQSCSVLLGLQEQSSVLRQLAQCGIARIAKLGDLMLGMEGAPHDGRYGLTELVRFVPFEAEMDIDEIALMTPYYKKNKNQFTSSDTFKQFSIDKSSDLLKDGKLDHGMVFSSGGTTGSPKYTVFTEEEFKTVGKMLAHGFISQGLKPGMKCINLFAAGNLWSSFLAVHSALNLCQAVNFPMGANAPMDFIFDTIERFKPDALFGIPSTLLELAVAAEKRKLKLDISHVFYAGEKLNLNAQHKIAEIFGTVHFGSAGYASVDAGVIGYQDESCDHFEHYLFSQFVDMKIIEGEAVVSSKARTKMPVINYKTGDRIEWTGKVHPVTSDPQFKLLGRLDQQLHLWGCRVFINEIEAALTELNSKHLNYQLLLSNNSSGEDLLELKLQTDRAIDSSTFIQALIKNSVDIKKSLTPDYLHAKVKITQVDGSELEHVERTGKVKQIIDLRF